MSTDHIPETKQISAVLARNDTATSTSTGGKTSRVLPTEVVASHFSQSVFLIVSQLGKVGNIFMCTRQEAPSTVSSAGSAGGQSDLDYNVRTLIGPRDNPLLQFCACQVANAVRLHGAAADNVVVGLALEDLDYEYIRSVVTLVKQLYQKS